MPRTSSPSVTSTPSTLARLLVVAAAWLAAAILLGLAATAGAQTYALGDTITVIQRPLLNIPAIAVDGDTLSIRCDAPSTTTGWNAEIRHDDLVVALSLESTVYNAATGWWRLLARVPAGTLEELFDLRVTAAGGIDDTTANAVRVIGAYRDSWYFVHVTDCHAPTHMYYYESGAETDSSEIEDLRAVIEDVNVINPEFVLLTGDLINEGELEDYLGRRYYSRCQRALKEFEVPVYLTAGNHDIGGWSSTPPSDGTARRDWWRFFGWPRLDNPPAAAPWHTQNYSFDYGPIHFTGLESYNNYDDWRHSIYGNDSFTSAQLSWLSADLAAASGSQTQVLFHHYDMQNQLNLNSLGIEMSLSGHIHYDSGSLSGPPWDLTTNNTCDGERSFRLIRVQGSTLQPRPTLDAGSSGQNFRVVWTPPNDGTHESVTAQVINTYPERFQNGQLKFRLPKGMGTFSVDGGTILEVDESGPEAVVHVGVDIPAGGTIYTTVWIETTGIGDAPPAAPRLAPARPNPFNPATELAYDLPRDMRVRLSVYDLRGREIVRLVDGEREAGSHHVVWDGRDAGGAVAPAGVYLARMTAGGLTQTEKMVLAK